jgi:SAM-dependent methyltransferase
MSTKTIQGQLWSIAPNYWARHFEPWFLPLYRKTLERLQLSENHLLLDDGCGAGLFSNLAIKAGAEVIGIDAAPGLLEIARQRNPGNNFLEEDLEALPFADNSFHVVTAFNSLQYAGSFDKALAEARRVLKPGGKLVIGIWAKPELSDATNVLKAIGNLLPSPPPGTPGPFALSEDGRMEASCESAGLKVLSRTTVPCPFLYQDMSAAVKSFMGTGPAAAAIGNTNPQKVEKVIEQAMQPYHITEGLYFLQNHFLLFIATK